MNKYEVNYGTGAGNFEIEGTLNDAMREADEGLAYTQTNCKILLDGEEVAMRQWYGVEANDEDNERNIVAFGSYGFYDEWIIF